jgi:hypothetical protein
VDCPICGLPVLEAHINTHVDSCMEKSAEKSARDEKRAGKKNAAPVAEGGAVLRGCRRWSLRVFPIEAERGAA